MTPGPLPSPRLPPSAGEGDRPVVVAVGDDQPALVDFAAWEAIRRGVPLRVVHAVAPPDHLGAAFDNCLDGDLDALEESAARFVLDRARKRVGSTAPGLDASFAARTGSILAVLEEESLTACEVVIGQDGELPRSWWVFDGHATDRFVARATVPVTVVPPEWLEHGGDVVLFMKDLCRSSLDFALHSAEQRGCGLEIVHLVDVPHRDARWSARCRLIDDWTSGFPGVDVRTTVVVHGSVAGVVAERAGRAALVVIGVPMRLHVPWVLDRSPLRTMILHAGVPLALVPREADAVTGRS